MENISNKVNIKAIGVGGMGINFVNYILENEVNNVEYLSIDTDVEAHNGCKAERKIFLDTGLKNCTWNQAEEAALKCYDQFEELLKGTDILFIISGMGGSTGSGIAPAIVEIAKKMKIFTISIIAKPFYSEGFEKLKIASMGVEKIRKNTNSLIIVPNEKLYNHIDKKLSLQEAYDEANFLIKEGIESIINTVTKVGFVNLDLRDIKVVLENSKDIVIRLAESYGENAENTIVEQLLQNNLFEGELKDSKKILLNITGGNDISLVVIKNIVSNILSYVRDQNVTLIWGVIINPEFDAKKNSLKVVLMASV